MSMPNEKKSKINRLISQWPRGTPAAASYLNRQGFSHDLLTQYKKSGWIQSFGRGAYVLSGDRVEWPGAVYTLQKQLGLNVHPGGKTALELKGYGHYLPSGKRTIFLYATQGLVLPTWFKGERLPYSHNMGIIDDLFIFGYKIQGVNPGGGHDNSISRIIMKFPGKVTGLDGNFWA